MAEKLLKFVSVERHTPEKRAVAERRDDFGEIYRDFDPVKGAEEPASAISNEQAVSYWVESDLTSGTVDAWVLSIVWEIRVGPHIVISGHLFEPRVVALKSLSAPELVPCYALKGQYALEGRTCLWSLIVHQFRYEDFVAYLNFNFL